MGRFPHVIVQFDFVPGVLFPELGFGTLVQRFRKLWLQFLLVAFPRAGPETGAAKHAAPFGLKTFKAFRIQHAFKYAFQGSALGGHVSSLHVLQSSIFGGFT